METDNLSEQADGNQKFPLDPSANGQNPRDRPEAVCYAREGFGLFSYGNTYPKIQDTIPLHLECEPKHLCGVLHEGDGLGPL
jgi:hypothetical protein